MVGEAYSGILTSDRCSAYTWIALEQWQPCRAHLKRDLTAMAERTGASHEIGAALLRRQRRLFRWWHRVREGTLSREQFRVQVRYLRHGFKIVLEEAASLPIEPGKKTPLAKTVRTCRLLNDDYLKSNRPSGHSWLQPMSSRPIMRLSGRCDSL
ncbi:MAG: transposase [Cyanobacteria bacterium P01_D01_bin.56]